MIRALVLTFLRFNQGQQLSMLQKFFPAANNEDIWRAIRNLEGKVAEWPGERGRSPRTGRH
jgi:hypothetical protein